MVKMWTDYTEYQNNTISQLDTLRQKYSLRQSQLIELKEAHIKLELQYSRLKEKYIEIYSKQEFKISNNNYDKAAQRFLDQEWAKANLKSRQILQQKQVCNQDKQTQMKAKIKQLTEKLQNAHNMLNFQKSQTQKMKSKHKEIISEYQKKLKQKEKSIKILFGRIYTLQKLQSKDVKMISATKGVVVTSFVSQEVQTDKLATQDSLITSQLKQITQLLLEQILLQYYQSFVKSILNKNDQPSLTHFKNNLATLDFVRLQPYCKSLKVLLKYQQLREFSPKEPNQKEKWVMKSLSSLGQQNNQVQEINSQLIYLFRLSSLYYRVRYSINSPNNKVCLELFTKMKILLFDAFFTYDRLRSKQSIQMPNV